ncbi:DUF6216 family protein [Pantoea ananatis]|uniref:DUF6216 family protein n=1 Tax=Pantoea ananas TaxID=553 RepID=UPI003FA48D4E
MVFNSLNTFLGTALGALFFKWLTVTVKAAWGWLHKVYPDEKFIVEEIGISAPLIRISHFKYNKKTREKTKRENIIQTSIGYTLAILFFLLFSWFLFIWINVPVGSMDVRIEPTHQRILIKPGEARNAGNEIKWRITPSTCSSTDELRKIIEISDDSKKIICSLMLMPDKKEALKENSIIYTAFIVFCSLALLYLTLVGVILVIDVKITKKIVAHNKKENERYEQYIT